jgi:hypothetical protein
VPKNSPDPVDEICDGHLAVPVECQHEIHRRAI